MEIYLVCQNEKHQILSSKFYMKSKIVFDED